MFAYGKKLDSPVYVLQMSTNYFPYGPEHFYVFCRDEEDARFLVDNTFMFFKVDTDSYIDGAILKEVENTFKDYDETNIIFYNAYGDVSYFDHMDEEDALSELQWIELYSYYKKMDEVPVSTLIMHDNDMYVSYMKPNQEQGDEAVIQLYKVVVDCDGTHINGAIPVRLCDMDNGFKLVTLSPEYTLYYGEPWRC